MVKLKESPFMEFEGNSGFWRETEDFYRTLMDISIAPIVIIQDGIITYVNKTFEEISGYTPDEVLEKNPFEFLIHPDDTNIMMEKYLNLITGKSLTESQDFRVISKSGDIIWARGRGSRVTVNRKPAVLVTAIDITKLKESEEFHRSLIDESLAPIYIVQKGKIIYVNRAFEAITGYSRDIIENKAFEFFVYHEDQNLFFEKYREIELGIKDIESLSFRIVTKRGELRWLTARLVRININGKSAVASTALDTTEIYALTEELHKKNEYQKLLSKILRHDILNDLTVIRASLEVNDPMLAEKALQKVLKMVEKIKDVRSLEEAIEVLRPVNVADFVKKVVEMYRHEAKFELNLQEVFIEANESLKMAIDNLVGNAIIHSQVSPVEIKIDVFRDKEDCVIIVADNGVGIPEEIKKKIFESGYSRKGGGLGLFLVKKIVEMLKGSIMVYDNKPRGAVFEIRIPISCNEKTIFDRRSNR